MKKLIFLLYTIYIYIFFSLFELILCAVWFDYFEIDTIVKMRSVTEKETALNMHEIVLVVILCGFR